MSLGWWGLAFAVIVTVTCPNVEADPDPTDRLDDMIAQATSGGTRSDLFDLIEKREAERARQKAERATREADTRTILLDIREKIFEIRLNLAAIKNGKPECNPRSSEDTRLTTQIEDLDRLAKSARKQCEAAGLDNPVIVELCHGRLDEITKERNVVEQDLNTTASKCSGNGKTGNATK